MCWLQQSAQLWHYPTFLLYPLLVIACIECFAGYRAWRFLIGFSGGVLGFVTGVVLCMLLGVPMLVLLGACAGAVTGVALFAGVVPLGSFVFILGSIASSVILFGRVVGAPPHPVMAIAAVAGLAGAVAAIAFCRPAIITVAAVAGAQQITSVWHAYSLPCDSIPSPDVVDPSEWSAFIVLATAGLLIQFATSRKCQTDQLLPKES